MRHNKTTAHDVSASMHHLCNILLQITAHSRTTTAYTKQHGNCRSRVEALSVIIIYIYEYYSYICIRLADDAYACARHHLYDLYMIYIFSNKAQQGSWTTL